MYNFGSIIKFQTIILIVYKFSLSLLVLTNNPDDVTAPVDQQYIYQI